MESGWGRSMLGILDLLNSDDAAFALEDSKSEPRTSPIEDVPSLLPRVLKVPRSRIHPSLLSNKKLVDIALRRKSVSKRSSLMPETGMSKLHLKLLEAGLRVRLILCPSVYDLYRQLTPNTARRTTLISVSYDEEKKTLVGTDISSELKERQHRALNEHKCLEETHTPLLGCCGAQKPMAKRVRLIDSNLVNLAGVSSKVLKSFQVTEPSRVSSIQGTQGIVATFNLLDTAVKSLFGTSTFTLVRVTRSSSSSSDGSVLLKLETAKPGDTSLIDDIDFMEDTVASLGTPGQPPKNLFIKKVVARPRYKSDMKIYIVPTNHNVLLYVDRRDFERDLINGVLDICGPLDRHIYTTFEVDDILAEVRGLVAQSELLGEPLVKVEPNHIPEM